MAKLLVTLEIIAGESVPLATEEYVGGLMMASTLSLDGQVI